MFNNHSIEQGSTRIRDVAIGAIVTLIVTVLSGIIIYYFTVKQDQVSSDEKLIYLLDSVNTFETENNHTTLVTVRFLNLGSKVARNVIARINFSKDSKIIDYKISNSIEDATTYIPKVVDGTVEIVLPNLMREEIVKVTVIAASNVDIQPVISLRSDSSLGQGGKSEDLKNAVANELFFRSFVVNILPIAFAFQFLFIALLSGKIRKKLLYFLPTISSANDTGFVLMHSGLLDDAEMIFKNKILKSGADPITLANYGLLSYLQGNKDNGKLKLESAGWWARTKHEKAVFYFNSAIIALREKKEEEAMSFLSEALKKSKNEINSYCEFSHIFKESAKKLKEN